MLGLVVLASGAAGVTPQVVESALARAVTDTLSAGVEGWAACVAHHR